MTAKSNALKKFLKEWMLVIGMAAGAGIYLIYHAIPALQPAGHFLESCCRTIQPILLFMMLFLAFCKIEPGQLRPHRWQGWLLLIQGSLFIVPALILTLFKDMPNSVILESLMLCLICPTATACAVVTGKLGGDMAGVVGYTILINILVSILVPTFIPLIHPMVGMSFASAFFSIIAKVFPLLIMPCLLAWVIRYLFPAAHARLLKYTDLSFYIWAASLTLAILMSTRAIVHSGNGAGIILGIAAVSAAACIFQFRVGKLIGKRYNHEISAGQALGQKNTVFGIWMGYTFLDPVSSIACGFYSIWHNLYNSWQLHEAGKATNNQNTH